MNQRRRPECSPARKGLLLNARLEENAVPSFAKEGWVPRGNPRYLLVKVQPSSKPKDEVVDRQCAPVREGAKGRETKS
jgi:hypothetical protein